MYVCMVITNNCFLELLIIMHYCQIIRSFYRYKQEFILAWFTVTHWLADHKICYYFFIWICQFNLEMVFMTIWKLRRPFPKCRPWAVEKNAPTMPRLCEICLTLILFLTGCFCVCPQMKTVLKDRSGALQQTNLERTLLDWCQQCTVG